MIFLSLMSSYFLISGIGGGSILAKTSVDRNRVVFVLAVVVVVVVEFCHEVTFQSALCWLL